jgi:glycosyltransferase involved in cell wall biosynthesis
MASEMANLLQDNKLREELRRRGLERASLYSWQRTAEQYLELYGETIGSHSARS